MLECGDISSMCSLVLTVGTQAASWPATIINIIFKFFSLSSRELDHHHPLAGCPVNEKYGLVILVILNTSFEALANTTSTSIIVRF